jgi:hypothetical protein
MKYNIQKERKEAFDLARNTLNNIDIYFTDDEILTHCRERRVRNKQIAVTLVLMGHGYGHNILGRILERDQSVFSNLRRTVLKNKDEKIQNLIQLTKLNQTTTL